MKPAIVGGSPAFPDALPLVRPTLPDTTALTARLDGVLRSGMLTNGPHVRQLETEVRDYLGVRHVVAVSSCTAGLMLSLQALGVDGQVVVPSFTFSASAHAVHWAGGRPRFADIHGATLTLDPAAVREVRGAAAVLATHVFGTPCDVEGLHGVADGTPIVYDAAHALGSRRRGVPVGGFGSAEVFSLSPTKVTVAGEGGLVATNDDAVAEHVTFGRDYGNPGDYDCRFPGLNARMSELHAAVAIASFAGLDGRVAHRNRLVETLRCALADVPGIGFPVVADGDVSTYKDCTLLVDAEPFGLTAAQLGVALKADGVDSRHYYAPPIHRQKAYAALGPMPPLPVTDRVAEQVITLPLWSHMTVAQVERVAATVVAVHRHAPAVRLALES